MTTENLKTIIKEKVSTLEQEWGLNPNQGAEQLKDSTHEACIAYGQWLALCDLLGLL